MSGYVKPSTEEIQDLIDEINAKGSGLTNWERTFMEDITRKVDQIGAENFYDTQIQMIQKVHKDRVR